MFLIELLFDAFLLFMLYTKVTSLVDVEKRLRISTDRWARRVGNFRSYGHFIAMYRFGHVVTFINVVIITFMLSIAVSSISLVCLIYAIVSNSLWVYICKNEAKFK